MKEVILTGIRSNDEPTIGNYLGAFLPMVNLQRRKAGSHQLNMFVPDLHSFTSPIDHENLYENTLKNLKYFVAAGLDLSNEDTFIYRQSYVPAHSEMTWILDCFARFGEMRRMTQFKEKSNDGEDSVSVGLFNYPVLMAADILLYDAAWVPVGDDQKQHLEITRDIGMRMNNRFNDLFVIPHEWKKQLEFTNLDNGIRVRSLVDPQKKMSKSISDPRGTILLSDTPVDAAKKIMSATTDSLGIIRFDWENQPGVTNLLQMLSLLSGRHQGDVNANWEGKTRYGDLKEAVADAVEIFLSAFQAAYQVTDTDEMIKKLETSEATINRTANKNCLEFSELSGFGQRFRALMRLDSYLAQYWPEYSRSQWQKYVLLGYVKVNDNIELSTKRTLDEDDVVSYDPPKKPDHGEVTIPIIFEDDNVVVLNKPFGMLTHAKGVVNEEFTVAEFMKSRTTDNPGSNRSGIVHRLDRDTSGVIIAAKNPETKSFLQKQFQTRNVKKGYIAVTDGVPKETEALIDLPLERNPKLPSSFRVHTNGKSSQTHYKVISSNIKYSVLQLRPATGRTHQLRVHMQYLGTPIVGDSLYKGSKSPIKRMCLHAERLEVTLPGGHRKVFRAPIPPDMAEFIETIQ